MKQKVDQFIIDYTSSMITRIKMNEVACEEVKALFLTSSLKNSYVQNEIVGTARNERT